MQQILSDVDLVLSFWFSNENKQNWFVKNDAFDNLIKQNFIHMHQAAMRGELDIWQETPNGCLAFIILLDQFSRNMFRGSPKSFASDYIALSATKYAIGNSFDSKMSAEYKMFLYMPLMHSENIEDQIVSVKLFSKISDDNFYALRHKEIIARFGRFPHRNEILGRESTAEEISFLDEPNSSF